MRKQLDVGKALATAAGHRARFVERVNDTKRIYPLVVSIDGVLHTFTDDGRFLTYVDGHELDLTNKED